MPHFSRRSFVQLSAATTLAATFRLMNEPMVAATSRGRSLAADAVLIDSNENPLGPCQAACDAISGLLHQGGRYSTELTDVLVSTFAQVEGLNPKWVRATVGSTPPLALAILTLTSPTKSYVAADPGFETGMHMAAVSGARVVNVPLTKSYAHDVKAMIAAAPDAGVFYVCNPNNPTGTLTPQSDIEYLVAHKPVGSIVLVDEAYIHFSEAPSALNLVKDGKEVIVLRTFSKVYGMAGLRCGFMIGHPKLLEQVLQHGGYNFMPITAVVAATASLKDPQLVPERRRINANIRQQTFQWLDATGYSYIPSESNCFLLDTRRPGQEVRDRMAKENVMIGRVWPSMPTWVRITVGTADEMSRFRSAFQKVMKA